MCSPSTASDPPRAVKIVAAVSATILVLGALLLTDPPTTPTRRPLAEGDEVPAFALRTEAGVTVSLDDLRGRPFVLHFCASWHPACSADVEILSRAQAEAAAGGAVPTFIDVLVNDDLGRAKAWYRDRGANWTVVADPEGLISGAYGVRTLPQTFVIGADSRVTARFSDALPPGELGARLAEVFEPRTGAP